MILLLIVLLALAVLAPLLLALRGRGSLRGAKELALDLHATQLRELDRDLAEARILLDEHKTARLEIQRRLLAAAAPDEVPTRPGPAWPILLATVLIPVAAAGLYLASGAQPFLPSADSATARRADEAALLETLRARLAQMDPATDRAREGYALLGRVEAASGHFAEAADAYRRALTGKFDPILALNAAEAAVQADGGVTNATADLYQRALAAAPQAPWRAAVEKRLAEPRIRGRP